MVTQVEIARIVGLDVSSVNKIMNRVYGPSFRKETIALVFKTAKKLGYPASRPNKWFFVDVVAEIFTQDISDTFLAAATGLTPDRVVDIRQMLKRVPHHKKKAAPVTYVKTPVANQKYL